MTLNIKPGNKDTGLRVKPNGSMYVDRSVFYSRKSVQDTIKKMRESGVYPKVAPKSK